MRNLAYLKRECKKLGLTVTQSGKREAKADYEKALREYYWEQEHPGQSMTPQIEPMLSYKVEDLKDYEQRDIWQDDNGWIAQLKLNGCRGIALLGVQSADYPNLSNTFTSRRTSDKNYRKQEMTANMAHVFAVSWPEHWGEAVLDGEVMSPVHAVDTTDGGKGGVVTANELQASAALLNCDSNKSQRIQSTQAAWLEYHVFDILQAPNGRDMRNRPYGERYQLLQELMDLGAPDHVELVPIVEQNKRGFYEKVVYEGGEGVMLKKYTGVYKQRGRSKECIKAKRFEEVDAFVTGFLPGEPDSGWRGLVGALELSCFTERGGVHPVAMCANIELEVRKQISRCGNCGGALVVTEDKQALKDGKHVVESTACNKCQAVNPNVALDPNWLEKVFEVQGQEWTSRSFRLKHARLIRERTGADGKAKEDCRIDLARIQARFDALANETGVRL